MTENNTQALYQVTVQAPETLTKDKAQGLFDVLEDHVLSIFIHNSEPTDGDNWTITLNTFGAPDIPFLHNLVTAHVLENKWPFSFDQKDFQIEEIPDKNWLEEVHKNFPPVTAGRFYIYGSHYDGDTPDGLIPLKIDAATAFGSGEHETTKGCLLALERLAHENTFKNALDMGCGSGILAIAMEKIWKNIDVTAIDIDAECIAVSLRHAAMNNTPRILFETGDGYQSARVDEKTPYDLIVANILADPLIAMAPDLKKNLAPKGFCILAGLLTRQKENVIKAHIDQGLTHIQSDIIGEWAIITLQSV